MAWAIFFLIFAIAIYSFQKELAFGLKLVQRCFLCFFSFRSAVLSNFGLNTRSTEIVQDGSPAETSLGYDNGKLQFYAARKKVEFGTSLNDDEAQEAISVVRSFLETYEQ